MRCFLFLSLVFLFIQVPNLGAYERGAWKKNEAAIVQMQAQNYRAALDLLLQIASELPFNQAVRKNIAMSYFGLGQQLMQAGKYAEAAESLQEGKEYNDQESRLFLARGIALFRNGNFAEAESELNEAWVMSGDEVQVLQQLGLLYYESDRMFEAVDIWQRALSLEPDHQTLSSLLEKAQRELRVEKELDRNYSGHFILSYAENSKADIGGDVLDALEEAYTWAAAKFGHYPERQTPVILYTQRQFRGLTGSPEWAAGLYDGKIRLSIGGLTQVTDKVEALLAHEFMHVMVREIAGNRVPFWLNEGLAELAAQEQQTRALGLLDKALVAGQLFKMTDLQGTFRDISAARIGLAYEQSHSFVRYLIDRFGWFSMTELLEKLKENGSITAAIHRVYGQYGADFPVLERDWRRQL